MSEIVIGVDGGGSKTRVLVGTAEGEVLATVDGPKSAVSPGQAARSADVIAELVTRARARCFLEFCTAASPAPGGRKSVARCIPRLTQKSSRKKSS